MSRHKHSSPDDNRSTVDRWGVVTLRDHRTIPVLAVSLIALVYLLLSLVAALEQEASNVWRVLIVFIEKGAWVVGGSIVAVWAAWVLYAGAKAERARPFVSWTLLLAAVLLAVETVLTLLRVLGYFEAENSMK